MLLAMKIAVLFLIVQCLLHNLDSVIVIILLRGEKSVYSIPFGIRSYHYLVRYLVEPCSTD